MAEADLKRNETERTIERESERERKRERESPRGTEVQCPSDGLAQSATGPDSL